MKISMIIPVYNTPVDKINRLFKSIECQKSNIEKEVIVVNDGSTEKQTITFLNTYNTNKFSYTLIDKANEGVSAARNCGLEKATGNYLVFIDSDDFIYPDYIETIHSQFTLHPDSAILIFNWKTIKTRAKSNFTTFLDSSISKDKALKYLCKDIRFKGYPWNKAINLDLMPIDSIPRFCNIRLHEDRLWCLELLAKSVTPIRIIRKTLYSYIVNPDSAINDTDHYFEIKAEILNYIEIFTEKCRELCPANIYTISLIQFFNQCYRDYFILKRNDRKETSIAKKHLDNILLNLGDTDLPIYIKLKRWFYSISR